MKDIPPIDLVRAELAHTQRTLAGSDVARLELRASLESSMQDVSMLTEILAAMIHRAGEAGITVVDAERQAAWDACWLRISVDVLEEEGVGNSVRVSLMPPSDDERKINDANLEKIRAENEAKAKSSPLKLLGPDGSPLV